jgi:hypothetical protein
LVTPWFRFLWESYRSVLEILRTNPKLEALYSMVAVRAFNFCLTYKRHSEFRRLCDILRQHLNNMNKCVTDGISRACMEARWLACCSTAAAAAE